ncbi:hypothetical protein ESY86_15865 [Subsaximicrobium wynnwilliamsii]|uniref:Uncharacterized protein n=1 Tax=Subsaximicrobium wynnwilliamsii TaxID=291179 RepID=A0A5C6ZFZ2_9FLAO|nr:hypothetical protein [Subsaximicrobium wynnwilliamsii]TXD82141.1 hypothetical protein ESY87_15455 [Subsaximicrobium wynnwilliamsii]TXD87786.1 hypothetical protein ESY86_15865 [Subsaximicrobium wynnwilliamsii]TXE01597.1 hypothetical protein ESY88_15445 [Subsaximicrobium wynnwilliamsii]
MALKMTQIENLLVNNKSKSTFFELIIAYSRLKHKIEDTENHSWYFKKGLESKMEEMASLNNHFEKMREVFHESTIDSFTDKINENNLYLAASEGKYKGFNKRVVCSWKISENRYFNELMSLKGKTELLMPIDYYSDNPEEFFKLID